MRRFSIAIVLAIVPGWMLSGAAQSYKDLKYPPLRAVQIPDVATFTLPNGMKIYLLEDHQLPVVRGVALVRTGNLFDPADKVGLATVTGVVMRSGGTKAKSGDQIDEQLENIAASVESRIDETYGQVSFFTLKERTDEVLGVFKDLLTGPEFRDDKIELAKNQLRSSISRRNDDPQGISQREFASIVYGRNTPYGWTMEYATVDRIKRADLLAFYQRYFFPANIMLAVVGDFTATELRAKLEKTFAAWNVKQEPVPPFPPVNAPPQPGTYVAIKTGITQTSFVLGQQGGMLKDKDYPVLEVMSDILGGGFRSRLFQKVRTQLGYAYNISSEWGASYDHPGLFQIAGSTKSVSSTEAIKVVEEELEKIRTTEVTTEELEAAKQAVLNSFVFHFDTKSKTLNRMLVYEYYGYPKDFIYQYQKAIATVTKADILRAAKERIHPKAMTLVAVGNPKDFGSPLTELGSPVMPIDLTIPEPKTQTGEATPESIEKGKQLLRRAQQAVGGADKLASVHDFVETADVQFSQGPGGMKAKQVNSWILPNYFRQDNTLPFGTLSVFSDGQAGWISSPQGSGGLPPAQLTQVREEAFRLWFTLLLSDRNSDRTVTAAGDNAIEITAKDGYSLRLFLDEKTGLPVKESFKQAQPGGPPAFVEQTLEDFREVNGVKVPYKSTLIQNGKQVAASATTEYKLNPGLRLEEIRKRPGQ